MGDATDNSADGYPLTSGLAVPMTNPNQPDAIVERVATHYCVVCAARWQRHENESWSLCTAECGPCCDNVPMDQAPIVAIQPDGSVLGSDHNRVRREYDRQQWAAQVERYGRSICAICDEPFEKHFADWGCPKRVAPRFKFPLQANSGSRIREAELRKALGKAFYTLHYIYETTDDEEIKNAAEETRNEIDAVLGQPEKEG